MDLVLGLVGGLSIIIWSVLAMIFGGFESFKLETSLISSIYPTSSPYSTTNEERKAKSLLMQTVAERGRYHYRYGEYLLFYFLKTCCCCCARLCHSLKFYERGNERLARHEKASEKLREEVDVVRLTQGLRVGQFIAKLILNKH